MEKSLDDDFLEKEFFGGSSEEEEDDNDENNYNEMESQENENSNLKQNLAGIDLKANNFKENTHNQGNSRKDINTQSLDNIGIKLENQSTDFKHKLNSPIFTNNSEETLNSESAELEKDKKGMDVEPLDVDPMVADFISSYKTFMQDVSLDDKSVQSKREDLNIENINSEKIDRNLDDIKKQRVTVESKIKVNEVESKEIDKYSKITMLEYPPRGQIKPDPELVNCRGYEVTPYVSALINYQVYSIASTRNMRWLFTGGEDGHIYKWDFFASMNDTFKDDGKSNILSPVYSMAVQSEGLWLLSGKKSGDIGLWSIRHDEGRCIHNLKRHREPVSTLKLTPDEYGLVSGSWDKNVLYWDLNTGGISRSFIGHVSQLSSCSFQPLDGSNSTLSPNRVPLLMTTSVDGQSLLWDVRDKTALPTRLVPPLKTPPWALSSCWNANGNVIYVGRRNSSIDEYDIVAGKLSRSHKLPSSSGPVSQVCGLPNGSHFLSASYDNIRLWDISNNTNRKGYIQFQVIPGHHGATISQMYVDDSGKYLITAVGSRDWDGSGANSCLFYEINPS
ncbi:hypothetical protein BB559_004768 [Furculomyces boomerangus]|uniref:Transcription factor spt8 beta-propeller domain-containing protein n=1 Tax=Furculomyces boomerangus TaxID=61424 RepID=A0A2T9YCT3_9FUNG|nr:hypothetical protein BB559_004768 [Furculomyces boomerangus]